MKKSIVIVVFLHLGFLSSAQMGDSVSAFKSPRTLFGGKSFSHKIHWGGFGGTIVEISSSGGNAFVSLGGAGAVLINRVFFFGGYGLRSVGKYSKEINGISQNYSLSHGGIYTGVIIKPNWLVHFIVSGKFGAGRAGIGNGNEDAYTTSSKHYQNNIDTNHQSDRIFVFTPQVDAQINIHKYIRLNAGIGYRITAGIDETIFSKTEFYSISYNFGIFFGKFH